ncbi:juvenile hormone esterase-like isoform X2 [Uranotaenia lowii]|uniref:juvenile hormone esterase-like isoform X2 n=1 Tax=Uranotaenia lowii TaxID=190385 RepID=UPI002478B3C6|nr:juvenile hormone esterase-like isoform X2 [Uranotaenia lowii]
MVRSLVCFCLVLASSNLGSSFKNLENDKLRICIEEGCFVGKYFEGLIPGSRFRGYLGVPFAKPPIGDLRFRNPQPVEPWDGDYDASFERSKCVQKNDLWPEQQVEGSEDCLYMNVFVPEVPKRESIPVMVFIHGGGFFFGSSSMGELGPERFVDTGEVILVVIQYRLGVFGFLSTGDGAATGNFGLKDQTAALRWIQRNIAKFGGDPEKVTIFGQSAGGASVQMHMLSPLSRGLFSKAIVMSGNSLGFLTWPLEDPLKFARQQAAAVGIESVDTISSEDLVKALRVVDAIELAASIDKLKFWHVFPLTAYRPVVETFIDDETFIAEEPRVLWAQGKYTQVPWMTGFVPNEGAFTSLAILLNETLLEELNENSQELIPQLVGCKQSEKTSRMLRERFFPGGTAERWLTEDNAKNIQLLSEAQIKYPLALGAKQHITSNDPNKSSLQMYYFAFKSNHSYSKYFAKTDQDSGVCHSDDLSYLFRSRDLFEDYSFMSPEATMSGRFVDFFIKFVYDRNHGMLNCTDLRCKMLKFSNSNDKFFPIEETFVLAIDEELVAFWDEIYSQ